MNNIEAKRDGLEEQNCKKTKSQSRTLSNWM